MRESPPYQQIQAEDGQYLIEGGPERIDVWPDSATGLTTGEAQWIAVLAGTQHGPVNVAAHLLDTQPPLITGQWDMVVERDLTVTVGVVLITNHYRIGKPITIAVESRLHRVRIHVRGRNEAIRHNFLKEPLESHYIELWPAGEPKTEVILVGPDRAAAIILE